MTSQDLIKHREDLEAEYAKAAEDIQSVDKKKIQLVANANAVSGAIQEVNFWINKFEAAEAKEKKTAPEKNAAVK